MAFTTENSRTAGLIPEGLLSPALREEILGDANPAMVLAGDGRNVLWSSDAAARHFSHVNAEAFMRRPLADTAPGTRRLAELVGAASGSAPRLERLRFFAGFRVVMLTVLCRAIALANGERALIVSFPTSVREGALADSNDALVSITPADIETSAAPATSSTTSAERVDNPATAPDWLELDASARAPRRFVFTLDRDGRIENVSPPLAASVGSRNARTEGRTLPEVIAEFDSSASERVGAAIAQGETWSGVSVAWPVAETTLVIPVELAALPIIDAARGVQGFSGFGRCRIDHAYALTEPEAEPEPLVSSASNEANDNISRAAAQDMAAQEMAAQEEAACDENAEQSAHEDAATQDAEGVAPDAVATTAAGTGAPSDDEPETQFENEAQEGETAASAEDDHADPTNAAGSDAASSEEPAPRRPRPRPPEKPNVVSIRTGQPTLALPGFQRNGLSSSERNAFREIAKALGAKFEEGDEAEVNNRPVEPGETSTTSAHDVHPSASHPVQSGREHGGDTDGNGETALIDRLPIGVLVLKGDIALYANRTLLDLTGYADFRVFSSERGAQAIFRKGAAPRSGREGFDTVVLTTREGEMIPVDAHLQMVDWDGGKATMISIRRAAELEQGKALRSVALDLKRAQETQAELRAVLDTATDGVITIDEKGHILSLNGAAEALFDINQNEIVGAHLTRLLHNDSHASALDYIEGLRSNGVKSVLNDGRDVFGREKKGGRIPLFMTLGRINEGEPQRFCAVLRDMTAWKRAEAELTEARQVAERASAKKSDFLTKISHEIRTPMNAIIGFAELMQDEKLGALGHPKYREYLGDIRTSGHHVVSLVNDLLDLAKIEAGRMEMNFIATDLNAIVASSVGIIQPQATAARVLVRTQLAQGMPQVVADERSIRQIVLNMLSNATRFTASGGQVMISTSLLESGEAVIRIRDTGIGMTSVEIEQALEPFRQVGTMRNKGGTGLGLPLTRALAQANRANFAIRSTPGEGTLVEITFPSTRVLAE